VGAGGAGARAECVGWFAPALYAAPLRLSDALPAPAAIDRYGRVYFNPQWVARLYEACGQDRHALVRQLAQVWYHEVAHWLREHAARAKALHADARLWNLAADMEINDYLPEGMAYPSLVGEPLAVLPRRYNLPDGEIAEWYYQRLVERAREQAQAGGQQQSQAGGQQQSQAGGQQQSQAGGQQQQAQAGGQQQSQAGAQQQPPPAGSPCEQGEPSLGEGVWDEGSGVHGQARPWELHADDPSTNALSDFDRQALQEEVARKIVEHQKNRGTLPAGWLRWAEAILKPKVNWREQLKRILRGVISEGLGHRLDYSYRRPHRRSAVYHPIYLPALQGEYKPRVACVVDTSGSISDRELMQSLAEVRAVLEALRIPVTIIPCDAVPYEAIRVFSGSDWLKVRQGLRGGGGTDMVAGLNAALALKPKPEAVIVLTDGHTPFPATRPKDTAVIWAIWQYGDGEPPKPPMPPWRARDVVVVPIDAA
jgi:predicted metal-dependent peptidase